MPQPWTMFKNATQAPPDVVSRLLSKSSLPKNVIRTSPVARRNLRMKTEEMTRKLARGQFACAPRIYVQYQFQSIDAYGLAPLLQDIRSENGPNPNQPRLCISGRKQAFSLLDFADSEPSTQVDLDEISIYKELNVGTVKEKGKTFLLDDFSVMKFWYNRKRRHPAIYGVALRVLTTPVSSSASERVFSALKLIVSDTRSHLSNDTLEYVIVIRSLTK